jgi:hypothetical protein
MVTKHKLRACHQLSQQVAPGPCGKKFINRLVWDIMGGSTASQESIFPLFYLAYMPIAHSRIKMHFIIAKLFIQSSNEGLAFASTDMPATVAPHSPVAHGYQIAAKNDLSFVNRNAHAMSLNGAPAPIIYLRVIT